MTRLTPSNWQIFSESEWDSLLLKQILPQLGIALREDFEVNPAKPDVSTLDSVVEWAGLLRPSMMGQLLEELFFPKWLNALYKWLTHNPNLREVADWCVIQGTVMLGFGLLTTFGSLGLPLPSFFIALQVRMVDKELLR